MLKSDLLRFYNVMGGSKARRIVGCLRSPGAHAVVVFRFGQWLLKQNKLVRLCLAIPYGLEYRHVRKGWGIDLPREATIGPGLYIGHYGGIIISPEAKIGSNVAISHQVTIGVAGKGEKAGCPTIGNDVYIGPGAKIFGKIRVGNNVKIGANAVIHADIPDNAIVAADPGFKILSFKGNRPLPGVQGAAL